MYPLLSIHAALCYIISAHLAPEDISEIAGISAKTDKGFTRELTFFPDPIPGPGLFHIIFPILYP